jgi:hypothetical protein
MKPTSPKTEPQLAGLLRKTVAGDFLMALAVPGPGFCDAARPIIVIRPEYRR